MKKFLSALLCLAMVASLCVFASAEADGSAANPYVIATADDLAKLAADVNGGNSFEGKYVIQTADIDLGNKEWTPIGTTAAPFSGVYNGQGHKISGLSITKSAAAIGLFGAVFSTKDHSAGIANLTVAGNITIDTLNDDAGFGSVVGWCYKDATDGFKPQYIINVTSEVNITVKSTAKQPRFGGVAGYCFVSYLENVLYTGKIDYTSTNVARVGGIVGQTNRSTFKSCVFDGEINVVTNGGNAIGVGIAAVSTYKDDTVTLFENCISNGKINVTSQADKQVYAAGILGNPYSSGSDYKVEIKNCVNNSEITGKIDVTGSCYAYVGGIFAYGNKDGSKIEGCVNTGTVKSVGGAGERAGGIGGVFSKASDSIYLKNCTTVGAKLVGWATAGVIMDGSAADATADAAKAAAAAIQPSASEVQIDGFDTKLPAPVVEPEVPATGDSMIVFAVVAAVAVLGTALVIRKKVTD